MIPFEDSVPIDIQECLLPYLNGDWPKEAELSTILMNINWSVDTNDFNKQRSMSDTAAFQLLYSTASFGIEPDYHTFRRSSVYAKYLATREPFNPQSINSMKQSLVNL